MLECNTERKRMEGEHIRGRMGGGGKEEPICSRFFTRNHVLLRMSFPDEEGLIM